LAGATDPSLGAVLAKQKQRGLGTTVIEGTFKGREIFEQLRLQTVDCPDPVSGFVSPAGQ
jgi:hypothetical protein